MKHLRFHLLCIGALCMGAARSDTVVSAASTPVRAHAATVNCQASSTAITVPAGVITLTVVPSLTNPAIAEPACPHYVALSTSALRQPELFVLLPASGAEPLQYQMLLNQAAANGYYAIGLAYPNSPSVESLCGTGPQGRVIDPACHQSVRNEIITGIDSSPLVTITLANSISGRLRNLLEALNTQAPAANWGQFVKPNGAVDWGKIRISGHSQGSGHAGLIATRESVARMCTFTGPGDNVISTTVPATGPYISTTVGATTLYAGPADWVTSTTATSASLLYSFRHTDDAPYEITLLTWDVMGHLDIAGVANVDSSAPPYSNSHALTSEVLMTRPGANEHSGIVTDDATPLTPLGRPIFAPVWQYMCFDDAPVKSPAELPCDDKCSDLGDAPDSTNPTGNPMSIHPSGALAQLAFYPTYFSGAAGTGPIHLNAGNGRTAASPPGIAIDSALGLQINPAGTMGSIVSNEQNAISLLDQDTIKRNIIPAPNPANGRSNRDGFDNAFTFPSGAPTSLRFPSCSSSTIQYSQFIHPPWLVNDFYAGPRFINVWIDFNRDGDWADSGLGAACPGGGAAGGVNEWFIQNMPALPFSGVFLLPPKLMPDFPNDNRPMWLRISIAERPAPASSIGNGPVNGYKFGETEDHLLCPLNPDLGLWAPCAKASIDTQDAQGGIVNVRPSKPVTFSVDLEDTLVYPITITWSIDGSGVGLAPGFDGTQRAASSDRTRFTVTHTLPKPIPTPESSRDTLVLGWYGCITCTAASLASAASASESFDLALPTTISVTVADSAGSRAENVMTANIGWRAYMPLAIRQSE